MQVLLGHTRFTHMSSNLIYQRWPVYTVTQLLNTKLGRALSPALL